MKRLLLCIALLGMASCSASKDVSSSTLKLGGVPSDIPTLQTIDVAGVEYADEPVAVEAMVAPFPETVWQNRDEYDVHIFSIAAWKVADGPMHKNRLFVLRAIAKGHDYLSDFPEYSVHRMKLLLSTGGERSVLVSSEPIEASDEFQNIANSFRQPVHQEVEHLGKLTLDRLTRSFDGQTQWNAKTIRVSVGADEEDSISVALPSVRKLWEDQANWQQRIASFAAKELLQLKNDSWLREGESRITEKQFLDCLELASIKINQDGTFTFWFIDGDLFWGNAILVSGDIANGPADATVIIE